MIGDEEEDQFIEVTWGPEVYTPVSFHTFTVGPFKARVKVPKGQKAADVFSRVWVALREQGEAAYRMQVDAFLVRVGQARTKARDHAKAASRGQDT